MRKHYQMLTVWESPENRFDSGYGENISYKAWCVLEMERRAKKGEPVVLLTDEAGNIALAREKKVSR